MCELCDGLTDEVLMTRTRHRIDTEGFTTFFVEGRSPWAYTVGLVESYDHPELVVTGAGAELSASVLNAAARRVRNGGRFDEPHPGLDLGDVSVRLGPVAPAQWDRGRFNMWFAYYDWACRRPAPSAVQVIWPDEYALFPPEHRCELPSGDCQPLLDCDPEHDVNGLNRAGRRRRTRRPHR